jgi:hypothetical protein
MGHEDHEHGHEHEHEHASDDGDAHAASLNDASGSSVASFGARPVPFEACPFVLCVDPIGGAAGDMLVAALLDLGADEATIRREVDALGLSGVRLEVGRRDKHAIAARAFEVIVDEAAQPPRDYAQIRALLDARPLSPRVRLLAQRTFRVLAEAEAKVHRQPIERVHFHEVGGVDALVDVVGACAGLAWLEANAAGGEGRLALALAPLPLGAGRARGAHGSIPVPAPAALELMLGLPVRDALLPPGFGAELVTPTGAALLRAWSELLPSSSAGAGARPGSWPTMIPRAVGYGAGTRDLPDRPNVVRLVLGEPLARAPLVSTLAVLEANVDDVTGEVAAVAIEALLESGALDAWAQPMTMKKGRPALLVGALVTLEREPDVMRAMLTHTPTLGVRRSEVTRTERPRRFVDVETPYGSVRVKIADGDGLPIVVHPELDRCREAARAHGVPVREVIRAALVAASR